MSLSRVFLAVALFAAVSLVGVDAGTGVHHRQHHGLEETLIHMAKPVLSQVEQIREALKVDWRKSIYKGVDRANVQADVPAQVKVSFIPQGVAVSFSTQSAYVAPAVPTVTFGTSPSNLGFTATGPNGDSYGTLYFHTVLLEGLSASSRYYFSVAGRSDVFSFVTAREAADETPFSVLVVGDMGLENSLPTIQQMKNNLNSTDFYLHIGDLSYADDFYLRSGDTYEGSWDKWQDEMEPITANIPYMTLPGNHEVTCTEVTPFLCPASQKNMTAYRYRFRMPSAECGGVSNLWYSYDYGMVHFIQIDTETDYPNSPMGPGTYYNAGPFGDQMSWLEADLLAASQNRGEVPWIIVSGHRPLYSSKKNNKETIAAFESLFLKYNVDVYFSGHVHWYERLWPLGAGGVVTQQNYIEPTGVVHLINGAAGNVEGHNVGDPQPFSAFIDDTDYGFGKLFVANSSALQWSFFHAQDGALGDSIWVHKTH